jgi:hypothetical protein
MGIVIFITEKANFDIIEKIVQRYRPAGKTLFEGTHLY